MNLTIKIKKIFLPKCLWDRHAKGIKMNYELSDVALNATYQRAISIHMIRLEKVLGNKDISCKKGFKRIAYNANTGVLSYEHESKYVGHSVEVAIINLRQKRVIEATPHIQYPALIQTVKRMITATA